MIEEYFKPGDVVVVNKDVNNKPKMIVKSSDRSTLLKTETKSPFRGLKCFWFNKNGDYCEAVFNTKDLDYA